MYLDASYEEPIDSSKALGQITNANDGELDSVHELRDKYGADLVMLMGSIGTGVSWVNPPEQYAFSYMNKGYVWYHTMAHELGKYKQMNHYYISRHSVIEMTNYMIYRLGIAIM